MSLVLNSSVVVISYSSMYFVDKKIAYSLIISPKSIGSVGNYKYIRIEIIYRAIQDKYPILSYFTLHVSVTPLPSLKSSNKFF